MNEQYDNTEDATPEELEQYQKELEERNKKTTEEFLMYLNEQKLIIKNNILETVHNTPLFPYVLEMEHLIGILEGVQLTDDPIKLLSRYIFENSTIEIKTEEQHRGLGINEVLGTNLKISDLNMYHVFRYKQTLTKEKPLHINIYLLIHKTQKLYLMFSESQNRILSENITKELLDRIPAVIEIQKLLNDNK